MLDIIAIDEHCDLGSLKVALMDARLAGAAFVVDNIQRLDKPCADLLESITVDGSSRRRHFGAAATLNIYGVGIKAFYFDTTA